MSDYPRIEMGTDEVLVITGPGPDDAFTVPLAEWNALSADDLVDRPEGRYIAAQRKPANHLPMTWGVYDTRTSSWPAVIGGRRVKENHDTEAGAQAEADRLNGVDQ